MLLPRCWQTSANGVGRDKNKKRKHILFGVLPLFYVWCIALIAAFYIANVLNPPSTTATVPVTNLAASLMR